MNHSGSVHTKFYSRGLINTVYHLYVKNNNGEETGLKRKRGLINFLPPEKWDLFEGGLNGGFTVLVNAS